MDPHEDNIDCLYAIGQKSTLPGTRDADTTKTLTSYSLFEFTKDIHSRLPRELRDIIYRYLLTEQDVEIICRGSSIPLNNFPCKCDKQSGVVERQWSVHTLLSLSFKPFAHEVSDMIYESSHHLSVWYPKVLAAFLDTDFFQTGHTPRAARLSKLQIGGCLDAKHSDSVDVRTLRSGIGTLLTCNCIRDSNSTSCFTAHWETVPFRRRTYESLRGRWASSGKLYCRS
jgi:hypothetical protein